MDDIIQVLLFVLTLVIFIFSAFRKQKKKPNSSVSPADTLLESIFGIPQTNPVFAPVEDEIETESYTEVKIKPIPKPLPEEGIVAIAKPNAISLITDEDENPYQNFDLRTAIIYNEILTRQNF